MASQWEKIQLCSPVTRSAVISVEFKHFHWRTEDGKKTNSKSLYLNNNNNNKRRIRNIDHITFTPFNLIEWMETLYTAHEIGNGKQASPENEWEEFLPRKIVFHNLQNRKWILKLHSANWKRGQKHTPNVRIVYTQHIHCHSDFCRHTEIEFQMLRTFRLFSERTKK